MTPEDRALHIYEKFGRSLGPKVISEIIHQIREAEEARSKLPYEPFDDLIGELCKRTPSFVFACVKDEGDGMKYIVRRHGPQPTRLHLAAYLDWRLSEESRRDTDLGTDKNKEGGYVWEA